MKNKILKTSQLLGLITFSWEIKLHIYAALGYPVRWLAHIVGFINSRQMEFDKYLRFDLLNNKEYEDVGDNKFIQICVSNEDEKILQEWNNVFDNLEARIAANPEVEFDICITDPYTKGPFEYAEIILPKLKTL